MAQTRTVAVVVGSLRKESFNRKLARAIADLAPKSLKFEFVDIGQLSAYNQDLDSNPPADWVDFRARIKKADAVLFSTPEYNRSVPGVLKNAIDIASRPYGHSVWAKKPCAIVSATPGSQGAFGANHHLRQSLVFLDMPTLQQPEMYISGVDKLTDDSGKITNDRTRELLQKFAETFVAWIEKNV